MNTDEKIALLEDRITQLESANANQPAPKSKPRPSFQRMTYDERGRGVVVTVGGNNGGY